MAGPNYSVVGLVELAESHDVADIRTSASFNALRDAFYNRVKGWVRTKDEWRPLNHNRACVILKDIASEGELDLATAKLKRVFREPHYYLGSPMRFTVTAGFAKFGEERGEVNAAMKQAAIALNDAKHADNFCQVYSPGCNSTAERECEALQELEEALQKGEFCLYYQPKIHAGYKTLIGAEALLRWHKNDTVIYPDEFIGIAERDAIIKPITWWAIKSAVAQLARWPAQLSLAVNVAPSLLLDDEILMVVHDALDIYGVKADRLTLEVIERAMIENRDVTHKQLHALRKTGVRISIDDFGTGYSSLSHFRDLPVDEIKIDQCFVRKMLSSSKDLAIVKAIIDLAHNFSLKVVAEGVETEEIAERLSQMRCDVLQGFVIDRPLLPERFEQEYRL